MISRRAVSWFFCFFLTITLLFYIYMYIFGFGFLDAGLVNEAG